MRATTRMTWARPSCLALALSLMTGTLPAEDQPQWGQAWSRNMVSAESNLPENLDPASGRNLKWKIPLGTETHSSPVVAGGRIYIGTNNGNPRDPKHQGDRGVLMCLDEQTGKLLWQLVVPKRVEDRFFDWPLSGISSPATVEGDRVYIVNNRGEVMCLDVHGLANGNDGPFQEEGRHMTPTNAPALMEPGPLDADIIWLFNLTTEAGIWSHDAAHSSILIHGQHLYLNTGTGVDNTHKKIRTADAPSLVVLDKSTGRFLARDRAIPALDIFHSTWSAPSMARVNRQQLVFFAGGNGFIHAFHTLKPVSGTTSASDEPASATGQTPTLPLAWKLDFDPEAPKEDVHRYHLNRRDGPSNFYGMPVYWENRLYVAGGGDLWWGKKAAWLKCLDITDSSAGIAWSHELENHVMSTPAIFDGLAFIADCGRNIHCIDAQTGQGLWTQSAKGDFWASPYVADGKVYIGSRQGDFWVLRAARDKEILFQGKYNHPISATVTAANGVIYVATMNELFAWSRHPNVPSH